MLVDLTLLQELLLSKKANGHVPTSLPMLVLTSTFLKNYWLL